MSTSENKYDAIENIIFTGGLKISTVSFSKSYLKMFVHLSNDLVFIMPTKSIAGLKNAEWKEIENYEIIGNGTGIHWPGLDEDVSLKGFLKDFLKQKIQSEKELILT